MSDTAPIPVPPPLVPPVLPVPSLEVSVLRGAMYGAAPLFRLPLDNPRGCIVGTTDPEALAEVLFALQDAAAHVERLVRAFADVVGADGNKVVRRPKAPKE